MVELLIQIIKRWLWLLLLVPLISAVTAYFVLDSAPNVYRGKALLLIGPSTTSPNPELRDLQAAGQLLETYAAIATTQPFLESIIADTGVDLDLDTLEDMIQIQTTPETQILSVRVFDTDPDRALLLTNAIVDRIISISPYNSEDINAQYREELSDQITRLEERIANSEQLIEEMEASVSLATSSEERIVILNNILQERNRLSNSEQFLVQLYDELQAPTTNYMELIEAAQDASKVQDNKLVKVIVSAGAGFLLVAGGTVTMEYLDDTLRSVTGLAALDEEGRLFGHITQKRIGKDDTALVTTHHEANLIDSNTFAEAENYRKLATRVIHKMNLVNPSKRSQRVIMLTSPDDPDVSAIIAANLAIVISRMGPEVTLIDANLYEPKLHTLFNLPNEIGLTDALSGDNTPVKIKDSQLEVLPSGQHDGHAFEIISSEEMHHYLDQYQQVSKIVLVSAPPLKIAATSMLSQHVDSCILVAVANKTRLGQVEQAMNQIHNMVGAIFVDGSKRSIEA